MKYITCNFKKISFGFLVCFFVWQNVYALSPKIMTDGDIKSIQPDEIACSWRTLNPYFCGMNHRVKEIHKKLGDPQESTVLTKTIQANEEIVTFTIRKRSGRLCWAFKKIDINAVAKIFHWKKRRKPGDPDELTASTKAILEGYEAINKMLLLNFGISIEELTNYMQRNFLKETNTTKKLTHCV